MKDIKAKILFNEEIGLSYFKMELRAPEIAQIAQPGQFVQVRCTNTLDPLLRRPFSVHRVRSLQSIEILYEIVGRGTEILAKRKEGEFIDVLGPLGNGFTIPSEVEGRTPILIAGGIGVAPLVFLAEKLREIRNPKSKIQIIVLLGAKTKESILCEKDFKKIGAEVHIATDDGTRGYNGFVSELFKRILRTTHHASRITIYACGPHPMLREIAEISKEKNLDCQVSVEEKMACGIGTCLGCAVKVIRRGGEEFIYKLACKDGPVFDAEEIIWD
ncbi:MAG: dihydroorotate dehydrogenase electron transfer subunit [Candidatus Omnitrophica bacterium]|nr:dihydroorotate dehydrogenase electron transfer subunit [Candidatus Omnitrophota bacterium]